MPFLLAAAIVAAGVQGFEQFEVVREAREEAGLELAFRKFFLWIAVEHDAGAHTHFAAPHAARASRLQGQGADRYGHAEVAHGVGGAGVWWIEPADGARIDAARCGFQFGDDFHGAPFRRARDRAAGIQGLEDVGQAGVAAQARLHGGGHLQHAAVARHLEQGRYLDGARGGDAADVVAQQVDDHQVFRAILRIIGQRPGAVRIFFHLFGRSGRRRAFHGTRRQLALRMAHEQLRRQRQQGAAIGQHQQRAIRHGLTRAQPRIQGQGRTEGVEAQTIGVVDLVGVAGHDVVVDALQRAREFGLIHICVDIGHAGRRGIHACVQPLLHVVLRQLGAMLKDEHLRQWRRAGAGRARRHGQQVRAQLVAAHADGVLAAFQGPLQPFEQGRPLLPLGAPQDRRQARVQARTGAGCAGVVEQGETVGMHGDSRGGDLPQQHGDLQRRVLGWIDLEAALGVAVPASDDEADDQGGARRHFAFLAMAFGGGHAQGLLERQFHAVVELVHAHLQALVLIHQRIADQHARHARIADGEIE